ncbi:MAG TPA: transglutaminase domain-containing protein [Thermoanaerobaculia bacterium]|nr:transglutaminase domain-containing protein [Thermoanaerobaculia bacterium]
MTRKAREIETLLLTGFAAVPLYVTQAISWMPVAAFHTFLAAIILRVALGKGPDLIPGRVIRWLAIAYMPFYFIDWRMLSGTAIEASTHLVLFIAIYQPTEAMQRPNQAQRMLTTTLIFVASLATSTHITVMIFVVLFAFLMFRQMMYVSHIETVRSIAQPYAEPPSGRAAAFYLAGAIAIGGMLFPLLPRLRTPMIHGFSGDLAGSSTSLTETIDLNAPRTGSTGDTTVVARVWMDQEARSFFAPIRLRGVIYDRYRDGQWEQTLRGLREVPSSFGSAELAKPGGVEREAIVQQRTMRGKIFLPVGTYAVSNLPTRLYEGPSREAYFAYHEGAMNLRVRMAWSAEPLQLRRVTPIDYPASPEVIALAQRIVGNEQRPEVRAQMVEQYLLRNYRYVANPADLGKAMSIDEFLLRERKGDCQYFAAGMVALLSTLEVPARIAGGFYAGRLNPLTGYYTIRREDAHAWTEVWDGSRWQTFDATPASERPGARGVSLLREYFAAIADSLNFIWDRYILTFGLADQLSLFEDIIAGVRVRFARLRTATAQDFSEIGSPAYLSMLAVLLALGAVAMFFTRRRRPLFDTLARHLERHGIRVNESMTIEEALRTLRDTHPEAARELEPLAALYEEERFSARVDRKRARVIRQRLAELKG